MNEKDDETAIDPAITDDAANPHGLHISVWDVPSAIECGKTFSIKVGVKCSNECRPDGWSVEVFDHNQEKVVSTTPGDEPWPETTALYFVEVELTAPAGEGRFQWETRVTAINGETPHIAHIESSASISLQVVGEPDNVLTVEAIDRESQIPIEGARVVVHPYRAVTNKHGLAEVRLPKGRYRIFVSSKDYIPFRKDSNIDVDMKLKAELVVDKELSDEDIWI